MLVRTAIDDKLSLVDKFLVSALVNQLHYLCYFLLLQFQRSLAIVPLDLHPFNLVLALLFTHFVVFQQDAVFDLQTLVFEFQLFYLAVESQFFVD